MGHSEIDLARATYVDLIRLHDKLTGEFGELFKSRGLTNAQFNVLRILRGAQGNQASCQYIGQRLISAVPDVTRLVDRMVLAGWVTRNRSEKDRRVVNVELSKEGLSLCSSLDGDVDSLHVRQFSNMSPARLQAMQEALMDVLESQQEAGSEVQTGRQLKH